MLFTDGITETHNPGGDGFGLDLLRKRVQPDQVIRGVRDPVAGVPAARGPDPGLSRTRTRSPSRSAGRWIRRLA